MGLFGRVLYLHLERDDGDWVSIYPAKSCNKHDFAKTYLLTRHPLLPLTDHTFDEKGPLEVVLGHCCQERVARKVSFDL